MGMMFWLRGYLKELSCSCLSILKLSRGFREMNTLSSPILPL
jgi:hypothetical protein